ncbi:MAG: hypothetical protein QW705_04860 [Zestosphaera sp.]
MEVVVALCAGIIVGVSINALSRRRSLKDSLRSGLGGIALLMTYTLVFMIGLRVADVLPDILSSGAQVLLTVLMFSAIPTALSLAVAYVIVRG